MSEEHSAFIWQEGEGEALPLIVDSPHSGRVYPDDFHHIVPRAWLRQTEDLFVEELFSHAPALGIGLLQARVARSYIDVNRAKSDLPPALIDGHLPFSLHPSERAVGGYGLIRHLSHAQPVYAGKIAAADVQKRLKHVYEPYHAVLRAKLEERKKIFGQVWHINAHSMPSHVGSAAELPLAARAAKDRIDFILGDRDGISCEADFTAEIASFLEYLGYRVAHNDPYKGVEIVGAYGKPATGVHSVQLEINRALYMDEETLTRTANFAKLQQDLTLLLAHLKNWVGARFSSVPLAAE
jgi:N-formylglutamate amidohydrolase